MKRIYSILKLTFIASILLGSQGCELELELNDRYTDNTIWENPESIDMVMLGMYNEFHRFAFGQFPIGYDNKTDGLTDIMKYTSSAEGSGSVNLLAFEPSRVSASTPQLNYWSTGYVRVRRLNEFIYGLNNYSSLSEEERLDYEAEARFIRGYTYFWLVKLYGSVVLLDELTSEPNNPRSSEKESWDFVLNDFMFAAENLPLKSEVESGRATKGAAYAFLARAALYAGSIAEYGNKQYNPDPLTGISSSEQDRYYQVAADAAEKVGDLGYSLYPDFEELFTTPENSEAIFSMHYQQPSLTHSFDYDFTPPIDNNNRVEGVPTAEVVNEFEMANGQEFSWSNSSMAQNPYANREPRFYGSILYNGADWQGTTLETYVGGNVGFVDYGYEVNPSTTVTGYYVRKYLYESNEDFVQYGSSQSWMVIRYAEVLLIKAEAELKLGNIDAAKDALNEVRSRVDLPNVTANSHDALMEAIEHERIVELAFEGHRYWDLRRWRKAHIELDEMRVHGHRITRAGDGTFEYEVVDSDKQDRNFTTNLYYLPIPVSEIANNNALEQIQGW